MGDDIPSGHFCEQDFERFAQRLREETALLNQCFSGQRFVDEWPRGGFELEAWLVDSNCCPAPLNEAFLQLSDNPLTVPELAKFNIELNGNPQRLSGDALKTIETELNETWQYSCQIAKQLDASLQMVGILPTVRENELTLANMSSTERFRALNEQVFRRRQGSPLTLDIHGVESLRTTRRDVMLEAAATSFQIHFQVGMANAVRFYNAAQIISAPMVAASANSPYLFGKALWDETRIPLFEQSVALERGAHGVNDKVVDRVSFGFGYAQDSLMECFEENLLHYPVLLPVDLGAASDKLAHVRLHNGTVWRWNRPLIGFDGAIPHLRIEHRVVPAGPTVIDSVANAALFFGLVQALGSAEAAPESLLGFDDCRDNFYNAARYGLQSRPLWLGGKRVGMAELLLDELLPLAQNGLEALQISASDITFYLGVIEQRIRTRQHGAAWQRAYVAKHGADMQQLAQAYMERQCAGEPVSTWSI